MKRPLGINYQIKRGGARTKHIYIYIHIYARLCKQFNIIIGVREYFRRMSNPCLFTRVFTLTTIIILTAKKAEDKIERKENRKTERLEKESN